MFFSKASLTFQTVPVFLLLPDDRHNLLPESAERPLFPLKLRSSRHTLLELVTHIEK